MDVDSDAICALPGEKLLISACFMEMMCSTTVEMTSDLIMMLRAMIDSGANVNLAPYSLATVLGLPVTAESNRRIGTADSTRSMPIVG